MLTTPLSPEPDPALLRIPPRRVFSRVGWTFFAVLLLYELGVSLLAALLSRIAPAFSASPWFSWLLQGIGMTALATPLCYLLLRRLPASPPPPRTHLGGKRFFLYLVIALAALYMTNMLSQILVVLVSLLKGSPVMNPVEALLSVDTLLPGILFGGLIGPIVEEVLFRGFLLRPLRQYGEGFCMFASGLIFALFHANLFQIFYAFVLGALFALIALRTGTILYCTLYHILINLMGLFLLPALSNFGGKPGEAIASAFVLITVLAGSLLLFSQMREFSLVPGADSIPTGHRLKLFLLSPGIIGYTLFCLLITILATFVL